MANLHASASGYHGIVTLGGKVNSVLLLIRDTSPIPGEPDVAVIVAVPSATEVTEPVEETVTTDAADDDQETVTPLIVAPF